MSKKMNSIFGFPPIHKVHLTPPDEIASRLCSLIGMPFELTGKTRTDGSNVRKLVAQTSDKPLLNQLFSLELLREMLVDGLIGEPLDQMATKNRGQALERLVALLLGYKISDAELLEGTFPDIPNQALEVKIQDSPTVDLGRFSPQFEEFVPSCPDLTTLDVRYLIALTDAETGIIQGVILCPGEKLGELFSYVSDISFKCQRSIPMSFFDAYQGKAFYNP